MVVLGRLARTGIVHTRRTADALRHRLLVVVVWALIAAASGRGHLEAQTQADPRRFVGVTFTATVTSVVDGDTVRVTLDDGSALPVRLDGINCPETGEPYSTQARNATRVMLFTKRAQLKGTDVDRYSRLVARVVVEGLDMSLELVKSGLACHFTRYSSDQRLASAERDARLKGLGFWTPTAQKPACAVEALRRQPPLRASGPYHGNTASRVFHAPSCRNYRCKNCTEVFASARDAEAAGFVPAGDCLR